MSDVELDKKTESDNLNHHAQSTRKLPSLSWKQRVIGFGITAGLAALFAILVSRSMNKIQCSQCTVHFLN